MAEPSVVCDASANAFTSQVLVLCAANLAFGFAIGLYFATRNVTEDSKEKMSESNEQQQSATQTMAQTSSPIPKSPSPTIPDSLTTSSTSSTVSSSSTPFSASISPRKQSPTRKAARTLISHNLPSSSPESTCQTQQQQHQPQQQLNQHSRIVSTDVVRDENKAEQHMESLLHPKISSTMMSASATTSTSTITSSTVSVVAEGAGAGVVQHTTLPCTNDERPRTRARLAAILIYPVQSCAAVAVVQARATDFGLEHDGRLVVIDFTGRPLTRAKHPTLSEVRPAIDDDGLLHLSAPGGWSVEFDPKATGGATFDLVGGGGVGSRSSVGPGTGSGIGGGFLGSLGGRGGVGAGIAGGKKPRGVDVGDAAADFFAGYLEIAGVRLVRLEEQDVAATQGRPCFVLATEASRAYVAKRVDGSGVNGMDMSMELFRPNLVVDGKQLKAFEEEKWNRFRIGDVEFDMATQGGVGATTSAATSSTSITGTAGEVEDGGNLRRRSSRRDSVASTESPRTSWRSSQRRRFGSVLQVGQTVVPDCGHAVIPSCGVGTEGVLLRVDDEVEVIDTM